MDLINVPILFVTSWMHAPCKLHTSQDNKAGRHTLASIPSVGNSQLSEHVFSYHVAWKLKSSHPQGPEKLPSSLWKVGGVSLVSGVQHQYLWREPGTNCLARGSQNITWFSCLYGLHWNHLPIELLWVNKQWHSQDILSGGAWEIMVGVGKPAEFLIQSQSQRQCGISLRDGSGRYQRGKEEGMLFQMGLRGAVDGAQTLKALLQIPHC